MPKTSMLKQLAILQHRLFLNASHRSKSTALLSKNKTSIRLPSGFYKQINIWKEFLMKEGLAYKKRKNQMEAVQSALLKIPLTVTRIWREPFSGIFMELSLDKLEADKRKFLLQNIFKKSTLIVLHSKDDVLEKNAMVIYNRNLLQVCLIGAINFKELNDVKEWSVRISGYDPTEKMLDILHSKRYTGLEGFDSLLKSYKIRKLNKKFNDNRRKISFNENLDDSQKQAVYAALNFQREFVAIQGPPGTGKTKVIAEIVYQCVKLRKRLIVCAPSNMAVDNALIACIKRGIDVQKCVRLGYYHSSDQDQHIHSTSFTSLLKQHRLYKDLKNYYQEREKLNEIEDDLNKMEIDKLKRLIKQSVEVEKYIQDTVIRDMQLIFCTPACNAIYRFLEENRFKPDLIVMDEASQMIEALSWLMLLQAPRFVIAGDHNQLDPIIYSKRNINNDFTKICTQEVIHDKNNLMDISLLERLMHDFRDKKGYTHMLNVNYRSNKIIQHWSNKHFYDGKLVAADDVRDITLKDLIKNNNLQIHPTEPLINDPLVLLDTAKISLSELRRCRKKYPCLEAADFLEMQIPKTHSYYNQGEALCVAHQLLALIKWSGLKPDQIGCITPYKAQTHQIKEILNKYISESIEISSVDAFQGQQREAIVMSFVRNNDENLIGFLRNLRRMNVAITRAKRQFFLVASSTMLKSDKKLSNLYDIIYNEGKVISLSELLLINSIHLNFSPKEKNISTNTLSVCIV